MFDKLWRNDLDEALKKLDLLIESKNRCISALQAENKQLKDEHYKDKEISRLNAVLESALDDLNRGFPINSEEYERIERWKLEHLKTKHPKAFANPGYFGAIGGNFSYRFTPTSIGTAGVVACTCGDEFCFREL